MEKNKTVIMEKFPMLLPSLYWDLVALIKCSFEISNNKIIQKSQIVHQTITDWSKEYCRFNERAIFKKACLKLSRSLILVFSILEIQVKDLTIFKFH